MTIDIAVPGGWDVVPEAVAALADGLSATVELLPAEPSVAADVEERAGLWLEPHELVAIAAHTAVLRVTGPGGSVDAAKAMLQLGATALEAGGLAVRVESSMLAHSAAEWRRMAAGQRAEDLLDAYVRIEPTADGLASRGMTRFGLADLCLPGGDEELDRMTLESLLLHCLREQADFQDGDGISVWPHRSVRRLDRVEGTNGETVWVASPADHWTVMGLSDVVAISAGHQHNLALRPDGRVVSWGTNRDGRLGDGTEVDRPVPGPVEGLTDVVAISAGGDHSLALAADGSVFAWGGNRHGQVADIASASVLLPTVVTGLPAPATAIAAGSSHSLAVLDDGSVWAWGWNPNGQLGDGTTEDHAHPAPVIDLPRPAVTVSASYLNLVLLDDGSVVVFGFTAPVGRGALSPVGVEGLPAVVAIRAGNPSLAQASNGITWEVRPMFAPDGAALSPPRLHAVRLEAVDEPLRAFAADSTLAALVKADGSVMAWYPTHNQTHPIPGLDDVIDVSSGTSHLLALRSDGSVASLGSNLGRELGIARHHRAESRRFFRPVPPGRLSQLRRLSRPTVQLVARDPGDEPLPTGTTKLGGLPDLPADVAWPQARAGPQAFVAQINLADLPDAGHDRLPKDGLLSFFYPVDEYGDDIEATVLRFPAGATLVSRERPEGLDENLWGYDDAVVIARQEESLPPASSAEILSLGLSRSELIAYTEMVETADGTSQPLHRMLGYPDPVQDDPRSSVGDVLLLQLDSDDDITGFMWGDVGRIYYLIDRDDLADQRWGRVRVVFQCH